MFIKKTKLIKDMETYTMLTEIFICNYMKNIRILERKNNTLKTRGKNVRRICKKRQLTF